MVKQKHHLQLCPKGHQGQVKDPLEKKAQARELCWSLATQEMIQESQRKGRVQLTWLIRPKHELAALRTMVKPLFCKNPQLILSQTMRTVPINEADELYVNLIINCCTVVQ